MDSAKKDADARTIGDTPIVLYEHRLSNAPIPVDSDWETLVEFLTAFTETSPCTVATCIGRECPHKSKSSISGNPMAWSPVVIEGTRASANVRRITALVLDFDHLNADASLKVDAALAPYERCWHTTHSHRKESVSFRIVLKLSRHVAAADWPRLLAAAVAMLDVPADPTCKDLSRLFYRPSHPTNAPHSAGRVRGRALDVDATLAWGATHIAPPIPFVSENRAALPDEIAWDIDGDAVVGAIDAIARYMPPAARVGVEGQRHALALALAGMLRKHGATREDARYILHEGFREGGSKNPQARANVVNHTWSLPEDACMTAFTRVCEILGEDDAKEIGDYFVDAGNKAFLGGIVPGTKRATISKGVVTVVEETPPPIPATNSKKMLDRLKALRRKKMRSDDRDDKICGYILDALLKGQDLVPQILHDDGRIERVLLRDKFVGRDEAILIAMGMIAFKLDTPFEGVVEHLIRSSLVAMLHEGEKYADLEKQAKKAFVAALRKKVKIDKKDKAVREARDRFLCDLVDAGDR